MSDQHFNYPDRNATFNAVAPDEGGTPRARGTMTAHADLRRQRHLAGAFAPEREGNRVIPFYTGEAYFSDVCAAIQGATQSVFIAGWQINWAVLLHGQTRLIDALKSAVDNGAQVYVMPWLSPKAGVDTGDFGTMLAVFQLNAGRQRPAAFCCPAGLQNDLEDIEETFFSHHQKLVVIDNRIAYTGGIDLAFGRRDDANFSLAHGWRTGPEVYNTGVPPLQRIMPAAARAYVTEAELLQTTVQYGLPNDFHQALNRHLNVVAASTVGRSIDDRLEAMLEWWQEPPDWQWLVDFRGWFSKNTEPAARELDQAIQIATDASIAEMESLQIRDERLSEVIASATNLVRETYRALLLNSWLTLKPNQELNTPGTQSLPSGGALYLPHQPRMPWQDVHVRIEGPSVYDLSMNFIRRWNSIQSAYLSPELATRTRIGAPLMPARPAAGRGNGGTGGVKIDVLRSAPLALQRDEKRAMPELDTPVAAQQEIHDAMVAAIRGAERFIYIENQFFQSAFGTPSVDPADRAAMSGPMRYLLASPGARIKAAITRIAAPNRGMLPQNHIARAIADRIEDAIRWDKTFHAYIVLPAHPEGSLADIAIVGQIHWTMQSLVFASDSLVNRVRLALYARKHCKEARNQDEWEAAKRAGKEITLGEDNEPRIRFDREVGREYTSKYLSLLNLRSCETLSGGNLRSEQVYVHSKLLIVDDRIVIVGSANINDRSLDGGRDSELAVCMTDLATTTAPIDGHNPIPVRRLAHEMRINLWKKHFALSGSTDIVRPATELAPLLDKPAHPATWRAIQRIARANALAYEQAFPWVPKITTVSSIWPSWNINERFSHQAGYRDVRKQVEPTALSMPFSKAFWNSPPMLQAPQGIRGFICSLPMTWTQDENNHPGMNMILLTERGFEVPARHPGSRTLASTRSNEHGERT